jgi:hypothetical protein
MMQYRLRTIFLLFVVTWSTLALGGALFSDHDWPITLVFPVVVGAVVLGAFVVISKALSPRKGVPFDGPGLFLCSVLACSMLYPVGLGCMDRREAFWVAGCRNQLKQIGLALYNYRVKYHAFPPAYIADKNGKPMHSWRVLLLPFLEDANSASLYQQYRFDEPWDGPHNRKLIEQEPREYLCLDDAHRPGHVPNTTSYVAVVGAKTAWPGEKPLRLADMEGRLGNTILLIEVANSDIAWSEPRDLSWDDLSRRFHAPSGTAISNKHKIPQGFFLEDSPGIVQSLLADGSDCGLRDSQLSPERAKATLAVGGYSADDFRGDVWSPGGLNWRNCCALLVWTASVYLLLRRASRYRASRSETPQTHSGSC